MSTNLPAGFVSVEDAPLLRETDRIVSNDAFRKGTVFRFSEMVEVPKGDKKYKLFLVVYPKSPEVRFGVWSTAQLERLMRDVKPGDLVYIRYDGLQPNPRVADGTVHTWSVARQGPVIGVPNSDPEKAPTETPIVFE